MVPPPDKPLGVTRNTELRIEGERQGSGTVFHGFKESCEQAGKEKTKK
jgi:hypothetical protein